MLKTGKRYQVFSIKEITENDQKKTLWVKAGSAWVNRDGSLNVYLDVLPLEGRLHVREPADERRTSSGEEKTSQANGSPAHAAMSADSMGGQ